jgi:hypothetical protein
MFKRSNLRWCTFLKRNMFSCKCRDLRWSTTLKRRMVFCKSGDLRWSICLDVARKFEAIVCKEFTCHNLFFISPHFKKLSISPDDSWTIIGDIHGIDLLCMVDIRSGYLEIASRRCFPSKINNILIFVLPGSLGCQICFIRPGISGIFAKMRCLRIFSNLITSSNIFDLGVHNVNLIQSVFPLKLKTFMSGG